MINYAHGEKKTNLYKKEKKHNGARDTIEAADRSWKNNALSALLQDYSSSCI